MSGVITPDEIRGREAVRKAIEEERQAASRKHELLKKPPESEEEDKIVFDVIDRFLHATDGVDGSGIHQKITARKQNAVVRLARQIEVMRRRGFPQHLIARKYEKLAEELSILEWASFRGPKEVRIEDHRADKKTGKSWKEKILGAIGQSREEVVEVEVVDDE